MGIILVLLTPPFLFAQEEINIDELRRSVLGEAPQELMGFSLGSSEVSLFLTGSWMGSLQGNLGFSKSPLGFGFASPDTPLLFKQEVDLTASLWINNRWFVEANFEDESILNTYRAGYQGLSGEFLQYAGIGNTGLDFPSFAYLDLGGNTPSSFGFYSRFGTENLNVHALVRYDAAAREERTFIGGRERTYADVEIQNTVRGISFVLPDTQIDSDITVFIEDEKGGIHDNNGRRWRLALPSEYAASRLQGLLELSVRPDGMIAVVYKKNGNRPWLNSMGSYQIDDGKFLPLIQSWFTTNTDLSGYPQCGENKSIQPGIPGEAVFGAEHALVIYQSGTFSPFERQSRYDAPSSASQSADLVRISTGNRINGFEIVKLQGNALEFGSVSENPSASFNQRRIFELLREGGGKNLREPESCWPLAENYPEIYLPPKGVFTGDLTVRFTNFSGASGYFIGTDAIADSIQVWRSGIQDSRFNYNQSSGEVLINGLVGQNELIRITFLKRNEGARTGSIAAGLGAVYKKASSPFSAQAAAGILWNLTDDSFTQKEESNMGSAGISARAAWDYDFLKAYAAAGYNFVQTDTTSLYRAAGMEGNETILTFPAGASFVSNPPVSHNILTSANRADLIYRNYYSNSILGNELMTIGWNAPVVSGINRPYPVKDSALNAQIIAAEFALDGIKTWTGFQVPIVNYSELFSYAQEIEIPFRFYDFNDDEISKLELIIQIGSLSGSNFSFAENPDLVWEKKLSPDDPGANADYFISGNYRIASFKLNDEDRLKLGGASFIRIIAASNDVVSGRVLLAPPIIRGASFRAVIYDGDNDKITGNSGKARAVEVLEMNNTIEAAFPEIIKRFHTNLNTQRVLKVEWDNMETGISAGVDGRAGELPLADYRELSFFIKIDDVMFSNETLSFIVTSGPEVLKKYQLEASLPLSALENNRWSKITIRYQGNNKEILVNGSKIPGVFVDYKPSGVSTVNVNRSSYIAVLINPGYNSKIPDNGTVYIDEIILEDAITINRINAGAAVEYSRPGTIFSVNGFSVLADLFVLSAIESEIRLQNENETPQVSGSAANRTELGFSVLDTKIIGNITFTSAENSFIWNAGHSISRKFGAFSVSENFYASAYSGTAGHNFSAAFLSDFYASFNADAVYDFSKLIQKWNLGMGYRPQNIFIPAIAVNAEASWQNNHQFNNNKTYGELWIDSLEPLIPDFGGNADNRRTNTRIVLTQRTKPVGAILGFEGLTNFTGVNNTTRSESSVWLDVPVTLERLIFNFRAGRGFKRHLYYSGDNALDDGRKFFESVNDSLHFWKVSPFYSLFAPKLNSAMDASLSNSPSFGNIFYSVFTDHFSARVSLPSFYNLKAFYIPSRIYLRMERAVEQKMDTRTDSLRLNGNLSFSAVNMFGAMGYAPLFKFYQTGEYQHSLEAAVNIPAGEDISWRFQSALSARFMGFAGGILNFVNTLSLRGKGCFTETFLAGWEVPTIRNLLSILYDWSVSAAEKQNSWLYTSAQLNASYEQLRRESLEITFDNSSEFLRWTVTAGHEEIVRIFGRLNFSAFAKLRLNKDDYTGIFIFDVQIGTALRIMF
ncbi:MAG: hypothetical protein FWC22_05095 [Treponema sp.]|nr:hypothetical protein [Treponema sp.]